MNYMVYKHTCPNGKIYIGITKQRLSKRFQNGNGYKKNKHFTSAIKKYGWKNIRHEVLFENLTKEHACQKEVELIFEYKSNQREFGYNKSTGGEFNVPSEEGIAKIRKLNVGKQLSEETKHKISETQKGKVISIETRKRMSQSHKGLTKSKTHRQNLAKALFKAVVCIETNETFESMKSAEEKYKISHGKVGAVCKGKRKTAGGYHWKYKGGDLDGC